MRRRLALLMTISALACQTARPSAGSLPPPLLGLRVYTQVERAADGVKIADAEIELALRESNAALVQAGLEVAESAAAADLVRRISGGRRGVTVTFEAGGRLLDSKALLYSTECLASDSTRICRSRMREKFMEWFKSSPAILAWAEQRQRPAGPAPATAKSVLGGALAVLAFNNKLKGLDREQIDPDYFADVVRSAALRASPELRVMTRENLFVLLQASGKKLEECEGECAVETGRRVGADLVVSGEILKVGPNFKLNLRLHDTREGRLLSGAVGEGRTVEELDRNTKAAVGELFRR